MGAVIGTSTRLAPRAVHWPDAIRALRDWQDDGQDPIRGDDVAQRQMDAFRRDLRTDPEAYGLREATERAADRLVDAFAPDEHGARRIPISGATRTDRETSFLSHFTAAVGGGGSGVGDAIVRRAAVTTGRTVLDEPAVRAQIDDPNASSVTFTGELFCLIYKLFLGDVVSSAIQTIIREKIRLLVPILRLTDPVVNISGWIAQKITSVIPDPCTEAYDSGVEGPLVGVGHDLVAPAVLRALGLDGP